MAEEDKRPEDEKLNNDRTSSEKSAGDSSQGTDTPGKSETLRFIEEAILKHPRRIAFIIAVILVIIIMIAVFLSVSSKAAYSAYTLKKDQVSEETYEKFYGRIYDAAESSHHVTNDVTISIGSLREENRLEVLKVSDVVYEITENEQPGGTLNNILTRIFSRAVDSWLKVPGSGVYTVDMRTAEFVIDNDHEYVLVRMMEPELTEFSIDYADVEELYFKDNAIFHNPARVGVDLVINQLNDAEHDLTDDITSNERFHDSACSAAVNIVTGLIRELNQDLPDLTIEVEFINGED